MHQRSGQHTCRLRLNVVSRGRGDVSRVEIVSSVPDDLQLRTFTYQKGLYREHNQNKNVLVTRFGSEEMRASAAKKVV